MQGAAQELQMPDRDSAAASYATQRISCVSEVTHIIKQLHECSLYFYIISLYNLSPDPWSSALSSGGSSCRRFVTQLCEVPTFPCLVQAVSRSKTAKR